MASDSPYDRNGRPSASSPARRRLPLYGGRYETPFALAHRGVGEWRAWRQLADANDLEDTFDLRATADDGRGRMHICDGAVDIEAELGLWATVRGRSPELQGTGYIEVTDVAPCVFDVALRVGDDTGAGDAYRLRNARFYAPDESSQVETRLVLTSEDGRHWLDLEIDTDVWLCMWLHRAMPVVLTVEPTRFEATVPVLERGTARGEA